MAGRHGKHKKRKYGVHKSQHSPETKRWNREHCLPDRPPWMDEQVYLRLMQIRKNG